MSRIRTIKPEFWTNEQVVECSTNARLLFIGLWNFCDDQGIHPYSPKQIKMEIFPGDDFKISSIENWLQELIDNHLIKTYHVDNKRYLIVTGWHHQKIEKPNSRYPIPQVFDDQSANNQQPIDDQTPEEGKGRESKGKERKGKENICKSDFVFSLPEWIDVNTWHEFEAMRNRIKKPLTPYASHLIVLELQKIKETHNHDPVSVLNQSIKLNYQDVYPLKNGGNNGRNGDRSGNTGSKQQAIAETPGEAGDSWPEPRSY